MRFPVDPDGALMAPRPAMLGSGTLLDLALRRLRVSLVVAACHTLDLLRWCQGGRTGSGSREDIGNLSPATSDSVDENECELLSWLPVSS